MFFDICKLFFYSFFVRKMILSNVLKINIITLDIANYVGLLEIMGAATGASCGSLLSTVGVPAPLGVTLGMLVGKNVGKIADEELKEINKKLKIVSDKNESFIKKEKVEQKLVSGLNDGISEILNVLIENTNKLTEEDKKLEDKEVFQKFSFNVFQNIKEDKFTKSLFEKLLSDEKIKKNILEIIKTA